MWRGVALISICILTFLFGLGQSAVQDSDEAFYAEAGREMIESGDWTTPHYNYEPRLQKPILYYWAIAQTYRIAGESEWAARIWSALAGVGLALIAAAVATRWCGAPVGWLAGAIVATSFGVVPLARQSLPDTPLAFFVSLAIWAAIEATIGVGRLRELAPPARQSVAWIYVAAAAAAFGMLTKGPVALVLPATVILPLLIWNGRTSGRIWPEAWRPVHLAGAAAIFLIIALPWYLAVMRAQGLDYAWQFFVGENVERFATSQYNQWRGYIYVPIIIGGLLPWSAFGLLWIRPALGVARGKRAIRMPQLALLCWAGGPLLFFMMSIGSQPRYILPCLVPLAILLARTIAHEAVAGTSRAFTIATVVAGGSIATLGILLWRASLVFQAAGAPVSSLGPAAMTLAGIAVVMLSFMAPRRAIPSLVAVAATATIVAYNVTLIAPGRPEPVETIAAAARAEGGNPAVWSCGAFARSLNIYVKKRVEIAHVTADDTVRLLEFLNQPERALAAVDHRALAVVEASLGRRFPPLASVTYLNTSVWQHGETLFRPDPSAVQRVVLIANR